MRGLSKKIGMGVIALLFCILFGSQNLAWAYGPAIGNMEMRQKRWHERREKFYEELGLTPQQQEQLRANREEYRNKNQALRKKIQEKRQELRQAIQKKDFNEAEVRRIHEELKAILIQREDNHLNAILEIRQILTPEQFQKFQEKGKKIRDRLKQRMHYRMQGGRRGSLKK